MTELNTVELDVFPNPSAGDQVALSWPGVEPFADVAVFDLTGRQVAGMTQVSRNESVNMDLPPGTYLIKMQTEIDDCALLIEFLEKAEKLFSSMSFDIKNLIEIMKMETL